MKKTVVITKKIAKRYLPAMLLRYRRRQERLAVIRKRNAHDRRLPEVQRAIALAKIRERQKAQMVSGKTPLHVNPAIV